MYMKVLEGLPLTSSNSSRPRNTLLIRLGRSLYGLKQLGRMWYNCLSEYLTSQGYVNNKLCPCVFIKKSHSGFVIVAVYVDDMNLLELHKSLKKLPLTWNRNLRWKILEKFNGVSTWRSSIVQMNPSTSIKLHPKMCYDSLMRIKRSLWVLLWSFGL